MKRKFSKFEIATIKRTAQNVAPIVRKKAKLKEQIESLQKEWDKLHIMQEQYEASIKTMTGGYGTEDLVDRVVDGASARFVLKYPDTVIPVEAEEMDEVSAECVDDIEKVPEVERPSMDVGSINPNEGCDSEYLPFKNC